MPTPLLYDPGTVSDNVPQFRPTQRVVTRVIMIFMLRVARGLTTLFDGDLKSGLLFLALSHPGPRASDVVRPITITALTATFKIAYETTRRNVAALAKMGLCERLDGGWALCRSETVRTLQQQQQEILARSMVQMLDELETLGFDFGKLDPSAWPDISEEPRKSSGQTAGESRISKEQIARISTELFLRFIEEGDELRKGSLEFGLIFVALLAANTGEITYDRRIAWSYPAAETPPPDELRRPVKVAELSEILGMPYETTRRYVHEMSREGLCRSVARKGFIIPLATLQRPLNLRINTLYAMRFAQAIGELKRAGFDFSQIATIATEYLEQDGGGVLPRDAIARDRG